MMEPRPHCSARAMSNNGCLRYAVEGIEVVCGLPVTAHPVIRCLCDSEQAATLAAAGLRQRGWLLVKVFPF